ncbi:hypothetical protein K435DRAFT_803905 [Dendrothele bispora CBS 962.96]|uniref:Ribonuclease H1 N-terminal domain-containing protein n=1 Tax=Dendrothele bispora (strain CBS 962.96) TaxID=1314807 RepID=A0A4S8LG21_DENBC|nr:hypothetical protein K435DRAFT_803905 [Dendrothele bispora CBS 962.96]
MNDASQSHPDLSVNVQLPPGSKLTVSFPDATGKLWWSRLPSCPKPWTATLMPNAAPEINVFSKNEASDVPMRTTSVVSEDTEDGHLISRTTSLCLEKHWEWFWPPLLRISGRGPIYAITRGRRVGIFWDWELVKDLTNTVSNARFHRFENLDDATRWYEASYNTLTGHEKLEVAPAKALAEQPIVDDRLKAIRGHDVDICVVVDGAVREYSVSKTSLELKRLVLQSFHIQLC